MNAHEKRIDNGTFKWKCKYCNFITKTRKELNTHINKIHANEKNTCPYCKKHLKNHSSLGGHIISCKQNPRYEEIRKSKSLKSTFYGKQRKLSPEMKHRISETMKRKIAAGEIEVPYKHNHYSKGPSYPEQYFINVFKNADISIEYNFQVGLYQLDFANPTTKKYIEIDGDQHYLDQRIVKHDIERTKVLEEQGWNLICRIKWSDFQKMSPCEKQELCSRLIHELS